MDGYYTMTNNIKCQTSDKNPHSAFFSSVGDGIHESTISSRFLGIILKFVRLEVSSTFAFVFLQNAIHKKGKDVFICKTE
jgi:hypothetical protein